MSTIYGDPRKIDLGFDVLDDDLIEDYFRQRKEQEKMYNTVSISMPVIGKVSNVRYVGTTPEHVLFDGDFKDYVRIDNKTFETKYLKNTNIGDNVDVLITDIGTDGDYMIKGSVSSLYESRARKALKSLKNDVAVEAYIKELTPAGYNVEIIYEGVTLAGFMPNTLAGINKLFDSSSILNQTLKVMIESFSRDEGTYIVSRRKYLRTLIPSSIKELEYDKVYTGHVTGTTDFGVFVEFNDCLTGMIHKTNIDPSWSNKLNQITPGFQIEFYIKEIIKNKIILTQVLRETLWDNIKIGQEIEGVVKDVKSFGVLIKLDDETNGLIHTSEMEKTSKTLSAGDTTTVKVIAVDRGSRKIFLTIP